MMDGLTWGSVILFLAYVGVTFIASIVTRRNVDAKGEAIKNETVATVNVIAKDALVDSRLARDELADEREKRARLEGQVAQLSNQATYEKDRADKAQTKLAFQDDQITKLFNQVQYMSDQMKDFEDRLEQAEAEKQQLIADKTTLQTELSQKERAYDELLQSLQSRIDAAVANVRSEIETTYQHQLDQLNEQIREKDTEINKLKSKLKETTHEIQQANPSSNPSPADAHQPDSPPSTGSDRASNAGGNSDTDSTDTSTPADQS